jgi:hypothetical protein
MTPPHIRLSYPLHSLPKPCRNPRSYSPYRPRLTGALNSSKPIKKPQPHRTRNVKYHLPNSDLYLAIWCCRSHCISFSLNAVNTTRPNSASFLTHRYLCVIQNSLQNTKNQGKLDGKKIKNVRYYSFGRNGCQYTFGRVSYSLLL